jgi:hypothetical protein
MAVYGYARLGKARLGAFRLNYYQPWVKVTVNGATVTTSTRIEGVAITDTLNHEPNTLQVRFSGFVPVTGQEVKLYLGDTDLAHTLFAGHILSVQQGYEEIVSNVVYDCSCIDYTWLLNKTKVSKRYTSESATDIVTDLIETFSSGFTTVNVVAGLDTIDEITFTNEDLTDAISRVMTRIGGYWYVDYAKDIHAFLTEAETAGDITTAAPRSAVDVAESVDLSQIATRVWSRGGGSVASTDVDAGMPILPVEDGAWYNSSGGYVQCGPQRLTYTSKSTQDGEGCVTSGTPGSAPNPPSPVFSYVAGNLTVGTFQYKVLFVNAAGDSDLSTAASVSVLDVEQPHLAGGGGFFLAPSSGGSLTASSRYLYSMTFGTAAGETAAATVDIGTAIIFLQAGETKVTITSIPVSTDARVTKRKLYRTVSNGSTHKLLATINDNTTTTYVDTTGDGGLGADIPSVSTAGTGQTTVGIPLGPTGTTGRKLYRTAVNASTFKLQSTTSDNTTLSVTDNTADGSLGAAATGSTLGASPGDTSLRVTDLSKFPSAGWARVDSQLVYYTGRSATSGEGTLTGVPASGAGAIVSTISAGTAVVVEPHLIGIPTSGVGAIAFNIAASDPVNVVTLSDDATAQTALAGFIGGGDDGIREAFISDERLSEAEAQSRGDAKLAELKDPLVTYSFHSRDQTLQSGRTVTLTIDSPDISGTAKIQRVTITQIGVDGGATTTAHIFPMRQVEASSRRFSFEDFLRQIKGAA